MDAGLGLDGDAGLGLDGDSGLGLDGDDPPAPAPPRRTLALARCYRPDCFADVVGQNHVVRVLSGSLNEGRVHHAYLFTGMRGVGKTTLARILAKALNCRGSDTVVAEPCCKCDSCREITSGACPDVIELDAASHTQVDSIRELIETAQYVPATARYKVYIIDEVHMLSRHAFNAMLKTLEEPPDHAKFILATTDPQMVPATVLSRCLRFNLRRLDPKLICARLAEILAKEQLRIDDGALAVIASLAEGSLRDALSILDEAIGAGPKVGEAEIRELVGLARAEVLPQLLAAVAAGDAGAVRATCEAMYEQATSFDMTLAMLAGLLHQAALVKLHPSAVQEGLVEPIAQVVAEQFASEGILQVLYEIAVNARKMLCYAPDPRVGCEMALLRMITIIQAGRPSDQSPPLPEAGKAGRQSDQSSALPEAGKASRPSEQVADAPRKSIALGNLDQDSRVLLDSCSFATVGGVLKLTVKPAALAKIVKDRSRLTQSLAQLFSDAISNSAHDQAEQDLLASREYQIVMQAFPNSRMENIDWRDPSD